MLLRILIAAVCLTALLLANAVGGASADQYSSVPSALNRGGDASSSSSSSSSSTVLTHSPNGEHATSQEDDILVKFIPLEVWQSINNSSEASKNVKRSSSKDEAVAEKPDSPPVLTLKELLEQWGLDPEDEITTPRPRRGDIEVIEEITKSLGHVNRGDVPATVIEDSKLARNKRQSVYRDTRGMWGFGEDDGLLLSDQPSNESNYPGYEDERRFVENNNHHPHHHHRHHPTVHNHVDEEARRLQELELRNSELRRQQSWNREAQRLFEDTRRVKASLHVEPQIEGTSTPSLDDVYNERMRQWQKAKAEHDRLVRERESTRKPNGGVKNEQRTSPQPYDSESYRTTQPYGPEVKNSGEKTSPQPHYPDVYRNRDRPRQPYNPDSAKNQGRTPQPREENIEQTPFPTTTIGRLRPQQPAEGIKNRDRTTQEILQNTERTAETYDPESYRNRNRTTIRPYVSEGIGLPGRTPQPDTGENNEQETTTISYEERLRQWQKAKDEYDRKIRERNEAEKKSKTHFQPPEYDSEPLTNTDRTTESSDPENDKKLKDYIDKITPIYVNRTPRPERRNPQEQRPGEIVRRPQEDRRPQGGDRERPDDDKKRLEEHRRRQEESRRRQEEERKRLEQGLKRPSEYRRLQEGVPKNLEDSRRRPEGTKNPGENIRGPEEGVKSLVQDKRRPAEGIKRPEYDRRRPEEGVKRPEQDRRRPEEGIKRPEQDRRRPEEGVKRPEQDRGYPGVGVKRPEQGKGQPEEGIKRPEQDRRRPDEERRRQEEERRRQEEESRYPADDRRSQDDERRRPQESRRPQDQDRSGSRPEDEERRRVEEERRRQPSGPSNKNERVWVQTNPERIEENERLRQLELMKRQREDERRKQAEDQGRRLYDEQRRRHEENRNQSTPRPLDNHLRPAEDPQRTQQPDNRQTTLDPETTKGGRGQPADRRGSQTPWVLGPKSKEPTPTPAPGQNSNERFSEFKRNEATARPPSQFHRVQDAEEEEEEDNSRPSEYARTTTRTPQLDSRLGGSDIDFTGLTPSRRGPEVPRFPAPVTRAPPVKSPSPCVWGVAVCCRQYGPGSEVHRLANCFEATGCPELNWDPDRRCRADTIRSADQEVRKFYLGNRQSTARRPNFEA